MSFNHMKYLRDVVEEDIRILDEKERTYQGSWKKREGIGAFMMLARKWDRIENMLSSGKLTYDIFGHISLDTTGNDSTVLAEIRDLRRYLLLVEAEMVARGEVKVPTSEADIYQHYAERHGITQKQAKERILGMLYGMNKPGTPEDGGHYERNTDDA